MHFVFVKNLFALTIQFKPYSASILACGGFLLLAMGVYFVFLRPPLLAEDLAYLDTTWQNTKEHLPGLLIWLPKVFWVLGGYIFSAGLLTIFISFTSFRARANGTFGMAAVADITSIGNMTVLSFISMYVLMYTMVNTLAKPGRCLAGRRREYVRGQRNRPKHFYGVSG